MPAGRQRISIAGRQKQLRLADVVAHAPRKLSSGGAGAAVAAVTRSLLAYNDPGTERSTVPPLSPLAFGFNTNTHQHFGEKIPNTRANTSNTDTNTGRTEMTPTLETLTGH